MTDSRTPTQLGEVSAQRLVKAFPDQADPNFFFTTASYSTFLRGRKFNDAQQKEFERAYRAEYKSLRQTV